MKLQSLIVIIAAFLCAVLLNLITPKFSCSLDITACNYYIKDCYIECKNKYEGDLNLKQSGCFQRCTDDAQACIRDQVAKSEENEKASDMNRDYYEGYMGK